MKNKIFRTFPSLYFVILFVSCNNVNEITGYYVMNEDSLYASLEKMNIAQDSGASMMFAKAIFSGVKKEILIKKDSLIDKFTSVHANENLFIMVPYSFNEDSKLLTYKSNGNTITLRYKDNTFKSVGHQGLGFVLCKSHDDNKLEQEYKSKERK